MSAMQRPLPEPTDLTRPFWQAARAGRLVVQACRACGARQFYPRPLCLACESDELDWHACTGLGRVYTYTINRRAANAYMQDKLPYAVVVVDLDEGVRMMGGYAGEDLTALHIGLRVRAVFEPVGEDIALVHFGPVAPAPA